MSVRDQVRRTVGRYEIVREVGRGATAVVYLARQTDLDRNVALKELAGLRAADPDAVERFLRESRMTGSLSHPNIVTVYEYFQHDAGVHRDGVFRARLPPAVRRPARSNRWAACWRACSPGWRMRSGAASCIATSSRRT